MVPPPLMRAKKNLQTILCSAILVGALLGCAPSGQRFLLEGKRLLDAGRYDQAVEKLTMATSLLPTNAIAWNYLGLAHHRAGQVTNAAQAYQKALRANPDLVEVRFNLGCLCLEQGLLEQAKVNLTTYTLRQPKVAAGWVRLGEAQFRMHELGAAEKSFGEALRLGGRNPEVLNTLGLIQVQRRRATDAVQYFQAALQMQTNYAPAMLNLAIVYHRYLANYPLAIEKYESYLATCPNATNAEAVKSLVRSLQIAQSVSPPTVATNVAQRTSQTTNLAAITQKPQPPTGTAGGPSQDFLAGPTTNFVKASAKNATESALTLAKTNVDVVIVPEPQPVKQAQVVSEKAGSVITTLDRQKAEEPSQTNLINQPEAALQEPLRVANGSPSGAVPMKPAEAPKRGLLQRINPVSWFRRQPKSVPAPTPLPNKVVQAKEEKLVAAMPPRSPAATDVKATRPLPPPKFVRYTYHSPQKPVAGDRQSAQPAFEQGVQAQRANRLAEAIQAYSRATEADPAFFEAHYNLALAAYKAGNMSHALAASENALAIDPLSADARYNFALALRDAGYVQDAVIELEKLLQGHPDDARAHFALANLYAEKFNQPALARKHYQRTLEIEPRHAQATEIRYWLVAHPE